MSGLQTLYLYSNSLSGTLPSSWSALLCQINVSNNCLAGPIHTTYSAATSRIRWIDVCNTRVWPRNFSIKIVAVCTPNTIRRCPSSDSSTLSAVTASWSRTATTLTLSSPSLSYMSPTLSCGTVEVKLVPFISLVPAAPAFIFVDIVSPDAANKGFGPAALNVFVVNAVDRAKLLQDPVVRMNISLM